MLNFDCSEGGLNRDGALKRDMGEFIKLVGEFIKLMLLNIVAESLFLFLQLLLIHLMITMHHHLS